MSPRLSAPLILMLTACAAFAAEAPKQGQGPKFQYKSEGIEISIPAADEPKVQTFNADTVRAAVKYLDDGAMCWVREKSCVNCHTTGPYMAERPALMKLLGKPKDEVLADFIGSIPDKPSEESEKNGVKYFPGSYMSVWRTVGLAEWDQHITEKLSENTERSLRDMMMRQSDDGSFITYGEVEIPHITTHFELTLQAARAVTAAPGWLAGLKDEDLLRRVSKMKDFLRESKPRNDYERVLRLQLTDYMPELVPPTERAAAIQLLSQKQLPDGGWSLRRMSDTRNWSHLMTDTVIKLIEGQPDAASPNSDPYMTAFAIVLMRQIDIPANDERIRRGIAWLKREQRVSGRWWMQSLYRGNYQYITYIATCQALKALALCDEIPQQKRL
jgi:squalene-hopene/tetraprenyl-beta-curcumene cyclase